MLYKLYTYIVQDALYTYICTYVVQYILCIVHTYIVHIYDVCVCVYICYVHIWRNIILMWFYVKSESTLLLQKQFMLFLFLHF